MPALLSHPESRFRIVSRRSARKTVTVAIRSARPSLLDLRLRGDPWICAHGDETVGVYFDSCELLTVAALPLDAAGLYFQLDALRHRRPRKKVVDGQ
jgi:hypothetical protein